MPTLEPDADDATPLPHPKAGAPGFYAIADACCAKRAGLSIETFGRRLLAAGVCTLQVRAKRATAIQLRAAVEALRGPCKQRGVPLIVNDRVDVAALSGADGVHVGRSDMPLAEIRKHFPSLLVGVSTHSLSQLSETLKERPDYVGFGPVFATQTKADAEPPLGLMELSKACAIARAARVPLVAIGGIDGTTAGPVYEFVSSLAAIGATLARGSSEAAIRACVAKLLPMRCGPD